MRKFELILIGILIIFLILFLPKTSADGIGNYPGLENGDWVIENETKVWNDTIILNGNLTIKKDGKLTLDNVILKMKGSTEGEFTIKIEEGGEFSARNNTNITAHNSSISYKFEVNGTMDLDDCEISYFWEIISTEISENVFGGIQIYSEYTNITNCLITNFKNNAIFCKSANLRIENTTIEGSGRAYYGIITNNSDFKITNNKFNNTLYGIHSKDSNGLIFKNSLYSDSTIYFYQGEVIFRENNINNENSPVNFILADTIISDNKLIGLDINDCEDILIENNVIKFIYCENSNLKIFDNDINLIYLDRSNASIENNTISVNNTEFGIYGIGENFFIFKNSISGYRDPSPSFGFGITVWHPNSDSVKNIKIKNNTISNNKRGIVSSQGRIIGNSLTNNDIGLRIWWVPNATAPIVKNNIIEKNIDGISLFNVTPIIEENEFIENNVSINALYGNLNHKDITSKNTFNNNAIMISQSRALQVLVTYINGTPMKSVTVTVRDRDGNEVWNGSTNEHGIASTSVYNLDIYVLEYEIKGNQQIIYSPFNITVEKNNETNWTTIEIKQDINKITIILKEPEPEIEEAGSEFDLKFMVGLISLILFFALIILSLIGVIPQDRVPIQTALVIGAFVIGILAFIANRINSDIARIGATDVSGMIIIHPITALTAGFLVAGALEAAAAFDAATDLLDRLEKFKIRGKVVFGIPGTIVILVNVPTIIAMPCGRILAAALMPAALYFGYKVAKDLENPAMVGVIVFAFIVNAAASCGPSPLGGIGTIGEGLTRMPIGAFSDAQQIGIIICTGVCALIMKFITPLIPADLTDEEEKSDKDQKGKKQDVKDIVKKGGDKPEVRDIAKEGEEKLKIRDIAKEGEEK